MRDGALLIVLVTCVFCCALNVGLAVYAVMAADAENAAWCSGSAAAFGFSGLLIAIGVRRDT